MMTGMLHFLIGTLNLSVDLILASVPMMVIGVFIAELIISFNATSRISRISRPLTDYANLHPDCGISFMMAFISPKAANAMLVKYNREGTISHRELLIAALMNSFPNIVMHWRYLLPVYIPLLGLTGLIYFFILTVVGFVKTSILIIAGRYLLEPHESPVLYGPPPEGIYLKTRVDKALYRPKNPYSIS